MRSSMLLGALCAASAMATPMEKRSYETDWTIVTVTTTITAPLSPADPTSAPVQKVQVSESISSAPAPEVEPTTSEPAPAPTTTPAAAPVEPSTEAPAPVEPTTTAQPTTTQGGVIDNIAGAWTSSWSSAWTVPAAEPSTSSSSSSSSTAAGAAPTGSYQKTILHNHNIHRSNHSATDLSWSADLTASAQVLASRCVYEHDTSINGGNYGQNIGYGVAEGDIGAMITNLMYNDEMGFWDQYDLYDKADPDMSLFESWGHFSQIVWKGTTEVGCATVTCDSLGNVDAATSVPFTVCNYGPPGNYAGEYADNVKRPLGQSMVTV